MAGFNYNNMQATAAQLLEKFGGASERTITYATSETFNVATQTNAKVESTFTGWGVVNQYDQSEIDGETIQQGDLRLVLEKTSQRPVIDNTVLIDGDDYRIVDVSISSPGGIDLVYFCQLRL